ALHARVRLERASGGIEFLLRGALLRLVRRFRARHIHFELQSHRLAEVPGQRLRELLLLRGGAHEFVFRVEAEPDDRTLTAEQHAVAAQLPGRPLQINGAEAGSPGTAAAVGYCGGPHRVGPRVAAGPARARRAP